MRIILDIDMQGKDPKCLLRYVVIDGNTTTFFYKIKYSEFGAMKSIDERKVYQISVTGNILRSVKMHHIWQESERHDELHDESDDQTYFHQHIVHDNIITAKYFFEILSQWNEVLNNEINNSQDNQVRKKYQGFYVIKPDNIENARKFLQDKLSSISPNAQLFPFDFQKYLEHSFFSPQLRGGGEKLAMMTSKLIDLALANKDNPTDAKQALLRSMEISLFLIKSFSPEIPVFFILQSVCKLGVAAYHFGNNEAAFQLLRIVNTFTPAKFSNVSEFFGQIVEAGKIISLLKAEQRLVEPYKENCIPKAVAEFLEPFLNDNVTKIRLAMAFQVLLNPKLQIPFFFGMEPSDQRVKANLKLALEEIAALVFGSKSETQKVAKVLGRQGEIACKLIKKYMGSEGYEALVQAKLGQGSVQENKASGDNKDKKENKDSKDSKDGSSITMTTTTSSTVADDSNDSNDPKVATESPSLLSQYRQQNQASAVLQPMFDKSVDEDSKRIAEYINGLFGEKWIAMFSRNAKKPLWTCEQTAEGPRLIFSAFAIKGAECDKYNKKLSGIVKFVQYPKDLLTIEPQFRSALLQKINASASASRTRAV